MKKWIKFLQTYTQKAKTEDDQDLNFKDGDIIQIDEDLAKSLIDLGIADYTDEPADNDGEFKNEFKKLSDSVVTSVETIMKSAMSNVADSVNDAIPNFATPRDHEAELWRGFRDEMHFIGAVMAGSGSTMAQNGITKALGIDRDDIELLTKAPTGQNISTDSEGNFLVPEPMADRIWSNLEGAPDSILPLTVKYQTAGTSMKVRRIHESSRKSGTGKRFAGIDTAWMDEAEAFTETKFTTGKETLELHKLGAIIYFTEEQLEDEGFDSEAFANQWIPEAIRFAVAEAFINGTGVGQPQGVLNSDALITVASGTRAGGVQASGTPILHWNLNQMYWRNINRSSANWYVHPNLAQLLEFIAFDDDTSNKVPVYLPANLTSTPFATLYGRPVIPYEFMEDTLQRGDILFADWSGYGTLTKAGRTNGVKTARSIHVKFTQEEVALRFSFRIDGRMLWTSPKEDLNGATTRSPIVTLGSRTGGATSSGL